MQTKQAEITAAAYQGRHAQLYDLFYADKPYGQEASFVHEILKRFGVGRIQRLLELACGTGSHGLAFEKLGYEVVGIDESEDMLAVARAKGAAAKSRVTFDRQDMRSLSLDGPAFDAVLCLFDSIGYVRTSEAIAQVMDGVYRSLLRGGLFIFEFWHAAAMLRSFEPLRVRRWWLPDREILRISQTKLLCAQQLSEVCYDIYELMGDGTYSHLKEVQLNRYFLVQEVRMMLESAGFEPLKFFAGFSFSEDIDENTWHVIALGRKS